MAYKCYLFIQIEVQYKAALKIQTNIYKRVHIPSTQYCNASGGFLPVKWVINSSAASQPTAIAAKGGEYPSLSVEAEV